MRTVEFRLRIHAWPSDFNQTAEEIRVGNEYRPLGPVQFHVRMPVGPNIPRRRESYCRAFFELKQRVNVGRRFDREGFAFSRFGGNHPSRRRGRGQRGDAINRPKQLNQICDVVRAEVEDGAAARQIEEFWIGVPMLHSVAEHMRGSRDDFAGLKVVDGCSRCLMGSAQPSVGCASDPQPSFSCEFSQFQALTQTECERLFRVDVLSGLKN